MPTTFSREEINELRSHFMGRQREILALTRALVEAESPSGDEAGSNAVVSLLAASARSISAVSSIDRITSENFGEHLRFRACEATGLKPRNPLTLLLTCDEESGSPTGRSLVEAETKRAHAVLVLEPPAAGGRVKTSRKGTGMFTIEARGRAAHAGLDPEKGASAVLELARQTVRLHAMNDPSSGTTVTVCILQGGTHLNVVPAAARAEVDVRFSSAGAGRFVENEILNLKPFDERVQLLVRGGINRPPLERNGGVLQLYEHAQSVAALLDFELGEASVGGASDGNFVGALGVPVLDGLGVDGDGAHAAHEHILIDDIPRAGALLTGLIASL